MAKPEQAASQPNPCSGDLDNPLDRPEHQGALEAYHALALTLYQPLVSCPWPRQPATPLRDLDGLRVQTIPTWQQALACLPKEEDLLQALAGSLMTMGRRGEALALYQGLVEAQPENPQRLINLAGAYMLSGHAKAAEAHWRLALDIAPGDRQASLFMAKVFLEQGRRDEAQDLYLSLAPAQGLDDFPRLLGLTFLQASNRDLPEAERQAGVSQLEALVPMVHADPDRFRALLKRMVEANELERALALLASAPPPANPWDWELEAVKLCNLAGDHEGQRQRADQLLLKYPETVDVLLQIGSMYLSLDNPEVAADLLHQALAIDDQRADVWGNLALAITQLGNAQEAISAHLHAIALGPYSDCIQYNFGNFYFDFSAYHEAQRCVCNAILLNPFSKEAWMALGNSLHYQRQLGVDLLAMRQLMEIAPDYVPGRVSFGLALLMHQRFDEGWYYYESRLDQARAIWLPKGIDKWDGLTAIDELLLVAEQGVGDLIQFMRYSILFGIGIPRVTVLAEPRFHPLLEHYGGFSAIHSVFEPYRVSENSAWYPMASVLGLLGITDRAVVIEAPYLAAEPESLERWRSLIRGELKSPIVGFNWQGNPDSEKTFFRGRSFPLETYAPLMELQGFVPLSLQKGPGSEQLDSCSFRSRFVTCQETVDQAWDFVETLSILQVCDLVITSDTSVAHLAGALGRPTWLLLKYMPDWRWGLEGSTTPWYGSMRLFRQPSPDDWGSVIAEVKAALEIFLQEA